MATVYKVLAQSAPSATTATDLYTVGAGKSAVVSTLTVANRATTDATFRVSIAVAGAVTGNKDYIAYDLTCAGNGVNYLTLGITLAATDVIRVYASTANLSFTAFGSEIS